MQYSGFLRRFLALIIDSLILVIPSLILGSSIQSIPSSFGLGVVFAILYYGVFESSALCATPGKALLGMVVLSESGEQMSFKAALIRYFSRYLSLLTLYIGYLMQLFTKRRQTLHDLLSECVVVDRESPDLNYFSVWKDQFKNIISRL